MDHAATENFHPAFACSNFNRSAIAFVTHIHFSAGFREGEMMGTELYIHVRFKKSADKIHQHTFEMSHMDIFIDNEAFDLMKHWRMGLITITAIGPTWRDNANRRFL